MNNQLELLNNAMKKEREGKFQHAARMYRKIDRYVSGKAKFLFARQRAEYCSRCATVWGAK